ncbi:MAG TPA: cyclopropane-fatty-acyl-phospholipid synthase family protein [Gemmatimonadales bacterium]|nr:cyclopropane-fatty-acyl-phospholipid synthase family protein [Gemmatimonadales bacterium]
MSLLDRVARDGLLHRLDRITYGRIALDDRVFGNGTGPSVTLHVKDPRFFRATALGGSLGAAEAFLNGWWETDDLVGLVQVMVRNRSTLEGLERGLTLLAKPFRSLAHALRRNSRRGSRRNIAAHYDLGNEFFQLFLDDTLAYSCGIFAHPGASLHDASVAKFEAVCRLLELSPEDHLLEIGTGWGGFAMHAAREYGCRVTTITISAQQELLAKRRIADAGLSSRITVLNRDYRDLEGTYDKLASIEMIEAVGHQFLDGFFRVCAERLKPGGRFALQAITIQDQLYHSALHEVDFIKAYVFPGSFIPSRAVLAESAGHTDLTLVDQHDLTPHYAETLKHWRQNLLAHRPQVLALGFDERFMRLWEFYFAYCEGGFRERVLGDVQLLYEKTAKSV